MYQSFPGKLLFVLILLTSTFSFTCFAQKIELINSGELIKSGTMAHDSGQYKKALAIYSKIPRSDTNYVRSLYERAVTCEADSQYKQAITFCQEALALPEQREYVPDLYNEYGNCLHEAGDAEKALKVFDDAIVKYPAYGLFYFNKGVVLIDLARYAEAEALFQQAILVNPYLYSAHYQLGLAALHQGKIMPAFLCFTGYLLMNPAGRYYSKSIGFLDQIARGKDDILAYQSKRKIEPDDNYRAVEEIVFSKIALDKGYKPLIALDDPISRQIQAVFEKLEYNDTNKDFYVQYYFPFYKQVFTEGKFELLINHIFSNANVKLIQDYKKNNKKALEGFINEARDYFDLVRTTRELAYKKRPSIDNRYYFENGVLAGKGVTANGGKILTGHWEFYFPAGNIKGRGDYDPQGKREGSWVFYRASGLVKAKENYRNGKLEGEAESYFDNGNLSSHELYHDDKQDGSATYYYYAGNIKSTSAYRAGKKEGESRSYYSNGNLYSIDPYVSGQLNGVYKEYYKSGGIKETQAYSSGKAEGDFKSYHEDGTLSVTGQNTKDKGYGEWKYYYNDGKLKEKRHYVDDAEDGQTEEFFENGQKSASYTAKKGKIDGEASYFYKDGKILSKLSYDNGVVRAVQYFNKAGIQVSASELKNNLIDVLSYGTDGFKRAHFAYDRKGGLTGPDTIFYASGKVNQILNYQDGMLEGKVTSYFLNGKVKSETNYAKGKENGYETGYYTNGKTEMEGWVIDGNYQGEWHYYDEKGRLTTKAWYLDNDLNGYKEDYLANGRVSLERKYRSGWLEKLKQFSSDGKVLAEDSFPKGSGQYTLYYPDKKVKEQGNYVKGDFDGLYRTFFFDGSPESSMYFKRGLRDSTYTSFYYGGRKSTEGTYKQDNKQGIWKEFDEDGKLSTTITYQQDQRNGELTRFYPGGNKNWVSLYKDDELNGTYFKYGPDGQLIYQVEFEDGKAISYTYPGKDGHLIPTVQIPPAGGLVKVYFPNGQLARECLYTDGIKNGKDILYHPSGQLWSSDTTAFAVSQGIYKEYYPDGRLKSEYPYQADNVDGICREYNPNGTLKKEEAYDNGSLHGTVKYFDTAGKPVQTMSYLFGTLIAVKHEQ